MITSIISIFNKKYGYRYWYQVTLYYKDKNGKEVFNLQKQVGLLKKSDILKKRVIGQIMPFHKEKNIPKKYLCNGTLFVFVNSYLGFFKNNA